MYYAYALMSDANDDIYIGSTADIQKRLTCHNQGKVRSTKAYRPWQLLEYHEFSTRNAAVQHEYFLKSHQQKELLKKKYGVVAK
ncbi:MAG: GIY-YIG nuclease family protein [bacterium]|nr:GIY-YIG nuclease family protein [bacterium]